MTSARNMSVLVSAFCGSHKNPRTMRRKRSRYRPKMLSPVRTTSKRSVLMLMVHWLAEDVLVMYATTFGAR